MEVTIDIRPLSVNEAWQGRRFKTPAYKQYEESLLWMLPKMTIPEPPLEIFFEWGMSNKLSDVDNPTKSTMDVLCKRYGFDDRDVHAMHLKKVIVKKSQEYIKFEIKTLKN